MDFFVTYSVPVLPATATILEPNIVIMLNIIVKVIFFFLFMFSSPMASLIFGASIHLYLKYHPNNFMSSEICFLF